jgi:hypothetical protein
MPTEHPFDAASRNRLSIYISQGFKTGRALDHPDSRTLLAPSLDHTINATGKGSKCRVPHFKLIVVFVAQMRSAVRINGWSREMPLTDHWGDRVLR